MAAELWLLLIDDDAGIRDALAELLQLEGYRVELASNGQEALACLRQAVAPPTAILLDLMMPVMDGFEFRAAQLADPRLAALPVLVLTAGLIDARVHSLQAAAYIKKPIEVDRLLEDIRAVARRGDWVIR